MISLLKVVPTLSLLIAPAISATLRAGGNGTRAAYFLDIESTGNSIVSLQIAESDGSLSNPIRTPTGGNGQLGVNAGPDGLFGQDAVTVGDDFLFTVNSGSNTLSMFAIDRSNPSNLQLVGNPADTLGQFPMAVAYSSQLSMACVLNGGAISGVACFSVDRRRGLTALDKAPRSMSQGLKETTPPTGPAGSAADIVFNPSSTAVFASVKGNPGASPQVPGYIYAWPVVRGRVSTTPVVNSLPGLIVDFSLNFLGSDRRLLVTDPSFGAAILDVPRSLQLTEVNRVAIPLQGADCWSAYSPRLNSAYVIDAGRTIITIVDPASGTVTGTIPYDAAALGGFDAAIQGDHMYVLAKSANIVVFDLRGRIGGRQQPQQSQLFDLSSLGDRKGYQGMATYP